MGMAQDFGTPTKRKRPKPVAKPKFRRVKLPATSGKKKPRKKDIGHSKKSQLWTKKKDKQKKPPKKL